MSTTETITHPASARALVIHGPRDLRLDDCPSQVPGPGQVRIRTEAGGVCGSDLHYYRDGGFGSVRLRQPMILGHEVSGRIAEVGDDVDGLSVGALVAVNPSRPCGRCHYCMQGLKNHCLHMRFYGSAMPFPHIQGAFAQELIVDADQCVVADGLTAGEAAMAEPLSVGLHAVRRAGEMLGKRVLVTGCGPIGALAIMAARTAGAAEVVATDVVAQPLVHALAAGADRAVDVTEDPQGLTMYAAGKGHFDVLIEASGAETALRQGIATVRPRGVIVQLGIGGDMSLPMIEITARELELRGSFRFHEEFPLAVSLMRDRRVDVKSLITQTLPFERAVEAFEIASDRTRAMKTQIALG